MWRLPISIANYRWGDGRLVKLLVAKFANAAAFLEQYLEDVPSGGVFLPTRRTVEVYTPVLLDVRFPELRDDLLIRGRVAWVQRGRRNPLLRAGLGIEFLPGEEKKAAYLLALARGDVAAATAQRKQKRLPTELLVSWRLPESRERHQSVVADIGAGGAFLRTPAPPPEGALVVLELYPPGSQSAQIIEGRVAWRDERAGQEGAGIEFRCRDVGGVRRLRELVRRIESQAVE
jgi:Tfp pilus assembly protein PilZ